MRIENSLTGGLEAAVHALEQVFAQVGDMLGDIAERYGVSESALRHANPDLGDRLLPGQAVRLPADGQDGAAPAVAEHAALAAAPRAATYAVRSGDTMSAIAKAHGVSLQALVDANPRLSNVNRIAVGQTLNLPGAAAPQPERVPVVRGAEPAAPGRAASPDGTPLYRQGDAAWGQTVLGRSRTISQAGCAMTSVAMAISKISGRSIDPAQLDRYLDQHHGYSGDALKWDTAAQAAGLHGGKQGWSLQAINRQLDAGRPVVVGVDYRSGGSGGSNGTDHWIAITARGQENGKPVYYANDPATGKQITLHENNGQLKQQDGKGYRTTGELVVFSGGGNASTAAAPAPATRPAVPVQAAAPVTPAAASTTGGITAAQLHRIMPQADTARWVDKLNAAMAAHGIDTPARQAAFLAQIGVESGQLRRTSENLNYSASRLTEVWPSRFPTLESAQPYAHNPEKLANHVYANRNGNGNEASGDGWRYRGGGLMQTTGRANYRSAGFENNPERLREDATAADSAGHFWQSNGLNERTASALSRSDFNGITRAVNGGLHGANERWEMYQRALGVLSH